MSAINAFTQKRAVHVMSDGLAYDESHTPVSVDLWKTHPMGAIAACVSTTGPALLGEFLAERLSDLFQSFDDLIAAGADPIRDLFFEYAAGWRDGDAVADVVLAGWRKQSDRPGLFSLKAGREGAKWDLIVERSKVLGEGETAQFFDLIEQEVLSFPTPSIDMFKSAGYDIAANLEHVNPETYLLHLLEIQRRIRFGTEHLVGGHALLTSIDATGLTQRIVHTWDEDAVGETIKPLPIDWSAWRTNTAIAAAGVDLSGLSRLQRERMLKKARKGTLR